ncbi:MAG: hypothetical protein JO176_04440 [Acidimicrobiia bacterium]|nr:hypothetical protein [Acidimicrobiia bacterium]
MVEVLDEAAVQLDEEQPARSLLRHPALIVAVLSAGLSSALGARRCRCVRL